MAKRQVPQGPLESRFLRFIRDSDLPLRAGRVVVAVSGGPDSVCLLHLLLALRDELGAGLHVAHLNHQLRGADSEADAQYVADMADRLGVPATVETRDVRAYQAEHRLSLEEAAREVRYCFFAEVAQAVGAQGVAVGHTRDDSVETILMHLLRGTGTRGLRGLLPLTRWPAAGPTGETLTVLRPLLQITRAETAGYCHAHGLGPRTDETNRSLSLFRNRVRLELLPLLKSYNPEVEAALLRTSRIASDELTFLDERARQLRDVVTETHGGTIAFKKDAFHALPTALQRHLLRMAVEELIGDLKDIETRHIEEVLAALGKPAGKTLDLPAGLVFAVEYDRYVLGPDPAALCPFPVLEREFFLNIPGETVGTGWRVTATVTARPAGETGRDAVETGRNFPSPLMGEGQDGGVFHLTASFDFDRVGDRLTVRPIHPGDRFVPLGLGHEKKVGAFMIDARIPRHWRNRVPIVTAPQHVVWVAGWRIDGRVKITESTKRVLTLEFNRI